MSIGNLDHSQIYKNNPQFIPETEDEFILVLSEIDPIHFKISLKILTKKWTSVIGDYLTNFSYINLITDAIITNKIFQK